MARPDLLVIGHSCFTAVNRNPYIRLASLGWSVELVVPRKLPGLETRLADTANANDPLIHWTTIAGNNQRFWRFIGLEDMLASRVPRAILLESDPASRLATQTCTWAKRYGVPVICFTCENGLRSLSACVRSCDVRNALRVVRSKLMAFPHRHAIEHVFVLSTAGVRSMHAIGFRNRVSRMPLGFDPQVFNYSELARNETRSRHNLTKPVIGYIGRMVRGKGLEVLITALNTVLDLDWHLLIDDFADVDADRQYADEIRNLIATNPVLASRVVRFHATHTEIANYMNALDVLVAPSMLPEQFGRVLVEAMACGKLVVASNTGAYPELIESDGIMFPPGNSTHLASILRHTLTTPDAYSDMRQRAMTRMHESYSIDAQARIIDKELRSLMAQHEVTTDVV